MLPAIYYRYCTGGRAPDYLWRAFQRIHETPLPLTTLNCVVIRVQLSVSVLSQVHGGVGSDYIKSIVFGGLDGIITTFSTIASVAGGGLAVESILTLGIANLIADGISMGLGDGLSSHAEAQYLGAQRTAQERVYDEDPSEARALVVEDMVSKVRITIRTTA